MQRYIAGRLLLMVPTLVGVAVLTFMIMRLVPGDIVQLRFMAGGGTVSRALIDAERHRLGLDKPMLEQFTDWMTAAARLDLGTSLWTNRPVIEEIGLRLGLSLELALLATVIAIALALPLGVIAALKQDTWVDYAIRVFSIGGLALPSFWIGILTILLLLTVFRWLPPLTFTPIWEDPVQNLAQLIWPALAVGYRYSAVAMRMTRSSVLEVMREDYVRTARAKGLGERLVVVRHALRNSLLPVVTVISLEFAFLIGGLVVTEQVFNLNGIGKLLVDAVVNRDYTMIQGLVLLLASVFVIINFLVDMLYLVLDPRIRYA
ncbi:MAG TPA: ABC transporter permease [Candidatus Limnocylindria bacterium]|jgi:peptide/nickel transport system permease protein|nr:ABC transporter permease [Candidatus Limnocylindria bacterium]